MRDYTELIERLRAGTYTVEELSIILPDAADAIEELLSAKTVVLDLALDGSTEDVKYLRNLLNAMPEEHGDLIDKDVAMNAILSEPTDVHYPSWYASIVNDVPAIVPGVHKTGVSYAD